MLFEVTKLRIWKQLTTVLVIFPAEDTLFEVTKLRIWKQLITKLGSSTSSQSCLRSQSYEFESNSQQYLQALKKRKVVWGHKVTNLKATHNYVEPTANPVTLFEVTKLRIWKQLTTRLRAQQKPRLVVWGHKVTNLKATHNAAKPALYLRSVVWGHKVTNLKAIHNENPNSKNFLMLFEITKLRFWKQFTTIMSF